MYDVFRGLSFRWTLVEEKDKKELFNEDHMLPMVILTRDSGAGRVIQNRHRYLRGSGFYKEHTLNMGHTSKRCNTEQTSNLLVTKFWRNLTAPSAAWVRVLYWREIKLMHDTEQRSSHTLLFQMIRYLEKYSTRTRTKEAMQNIYLLYTQYWKYVSFPQSELYFQWNPNKILVWFLWILPRCNIKIIIFIFDKELRLKVILTGSSLCKL